MRVPRNVTISECLLLRSHSCSPAALWAVYVDDIDGFASPRVDGGCGDINIRFRWVLVWAAEFRIVDILAD